jgi:hypothetical protein
VPVATSIAAPLRRLERVGARPRGQPRPHTYVAPVNFWFVAIAADGVHTLPKSTPLVQGIPFRRDEGIEGIVRVESDGEAEERRRVYRNTLAGEGWYRRESRARR